MEDVSTGPPSASLSNPAAQWSSVNWQNVLKNRWGRGGGGGGEGGRSVRGWGGESLAETNCANGTAADVNKH